MKWVAVIYAVLIGLLSFHLYQKPDWNMDMIGYMGNALMTNHTPIEKAHQLVYEEIRRLPKESRNSLLGLTPSGDTTQDASRKARAEHVDYFAEFLPCFAIRPAYNQLLFLVSRFFGLSQSAVLISVLSYFLLGMLVFRWACDYVLPRYAAAFSLVLMLMPPITQIGRTSISDAFSTLVATFALYLVFEKKRDLAGLGILLFSIFVRTDNVVLASGVFVALWLFRRLAFWQMAILGLLAAACVVFLNRLAGDYGLAMLYYRNFVGTPTAPAEMTVSLSFAQYRTALRGSLSLIMQGWLIPFFFLALVGWFRSSRLAIISAVGFAYILVHFLILPNWVERWFVVAYIPMALSSFCVKDVRHQTAFQGLESAISQETRSIGTSNSHLPSS